MFYGVLRLFYSLFAEKLFQRTGAKYMLFTLVVGYFAYAQYDVFFLHVILNDSEESHRVSEEYIFYGKTPSREFAAPTARKDDKIACHRERKRGDPLE